VKPYRLFLTDGVQRLPLGAFEASSFLDAARCAAADYSATFSRLVLDWRVVDESGESWPVKSLRPARSSRRGPSTTQAKLPGA
jgi:hypothetical protein